MRVQRKRAVGWLPVVMLVSGLVACAVTRGDGALSLPAEEAVWDGDPRFWSFRDGVIVGESTPETPCDRTTYLVWRGGEVSDFELTFQVRISGGNSGVQFRSREPERWDVHGYQADLDAANQWTGCLYEQGGRGVVATRGQHVAFDAEGVRTDAELPNAAEVLALPGTDQPEWIDYRIRAVGDVIAFEVNGERTVEIVDRAPEAAQRGLLALQMHQGGPMKVEYRDIVLRRLTEAPVLTASLTAPEGPSASWIWTAEAGDNQEVWLRRSFEVGEDVTSAELWASCDNAMQIFLNGDSVAVSNTWQRPIVVDVGEDLRAGTNQLSVWAQNNFGQAGLVLELTIEDARGTTRVLSDSDWLATLEDPGPDWTLVERDPVPAAEPGAGVGVDQGWVRATRIAGYGASPWGILEDAGPPAPSEALAASEIELPAGFEAELLYSVPRVRQGSWVSLCADDSGRLYASDQYGELYRITVSPQGTDRPVVVEELGIELGEAHGLLWAFDALYVVVSKGESYESGLYRVRDTDGDDRLDTQELLSNFDGKSSGEHGPHAVVLSPDGESLYIVAGNHVGLPEIASSRVPEVWDEDVLLPTIEDPNGHAVGKLAPGGWVVRTDPDATAFELVSSGYRNAYDLAFDTNGELFTFDSDMEWDTGLPWYRPTRILHVTSGSQFGWRTGSGKWPAFYPDSLPEVVDIGLSSPTGIAMGTGARFPEHWQRTLFAGDWAYGTIYAVQLEEAGSSYRGISEPFLTGKPLPVTDLTIAPDGALYFTTGGRRAQSGLYRVTWTGGEEGGSGEAAASAGSAEARTRRHALEAFHGRADPRAIELAWPALSDSDRHLRFAARLVLEFQPVAEWRTRALAETDPVASIEALLALIRVDEDLTSAEVVGRLETWDWEGLERDELLAALRVLGLAILRVPDFETDAQGFYPRIATRLPAGDGDVDRELVRLLARVDAPGILAPALDLLEDAGTQESAIHYAYALSSVRTGWDDASRARLLAWFDAGTEDYVGGNSFRLYLEEMRNRATYAMGTSLAIEASVTDERFLPRTDLEPLAFVEDYDADDLRPELTRLKSGRDYERGRSLFRQTSCLQCHRIAGDGGGTGPDLTGTAGRYSAQDLLDSLIDPSAVVSDQYRDEEVWTGNGGVAVGRVVSDTNDMLVVREASGARVEIAKSDVELRREHPLSRMPEGLIDVLTVEEILDLLAYVLAGGDAHDPAFD